MQKKKMHFEISERKMILRLFDVLLFYSFSMRLIFFRFRLSEARYQSVSGAFFVMYLVFLQLFLNLQVASSEFQVLKVLC
jgi:hypothetical protein